MTTTEGLSLRNTSPTLCAWTDDGKMAHEIPRAISATCDRRMGVVSLILTPGPAGAATPRSRGRDRSPRSSTAGPRRGHTSCCEHSTRASRDSQLKLGPGVLRLQVALRLEGGHAAGARGRHGLAIGEVGDVTGRDDARHGGLGRARHDLDVLVRVEVELPLEDR